MITRRGVYASVARLERARRETAGGYPGRNDATYGGGTARGGGFCCGWGGVCGQSFRWRAPFFPPYKPGEKAPLYTVERRAVSDSVERFLATTVVCDFNFAVRSREMTHT